MRVLLRLFLAVLSIAVLWAIFYPVVAGGSMIPSCYLMGADRKPIAGKTVFVRCNGMVAERTTNNRGGFDPPKPCRETPRVDGYGLAYISSHSGFGPFHQYHFSPLGTLAFRFLDEKGAPLDCRAILKVRDGRTFDAHGLNGEVRIGSVPLAVRYVNYSVTRPDLRLREVKRIALGDSVSYKIIFEKNPHPGKSPQWYSKLP